MKSTLLFAVVIALSAAGPARAQAPWQFKWQKGQALSYKVEHVTSITEVVEEQKSTSASKLNLTKQWKVADVDGKGVATLHLSITALRQEQTRPGGDTLLFDSANLDKSTPELKAQMAKFIGQTVAVIRVDTQGRVLEVKQGVADRYEGEPPFALVLPLVAPKENQAWKRKYQLTLDPPHGTGEKFEAEQTYKCEKIADGKATLALTTELKTRPDSTKDEIPLLQKLAQGRLVFDFGSGRLASAVIEINRTINEHQGKGSSYHYQSRYSEQFLPDVRGSLDK